MLFFDSRGKVLIFKHPHFLSVRSDKRCPPTSNNISVQEQSDHQKGKSTAAGSSENLQSLSPVTLKAKLKVKITYTVIKVDMPLINCLQNFTRHLTFL